MLFRESSCHRNQLKDIQEVLPKYVSYFQRCMFEHKYDMDCKQGNGSHLLKKISHKHMCNQKNLKQLSKEHKFNQLFAHGKSCKFALFVWAPLIGSIVTKSKGGMIPYRLTKSIGPSSIYGYHIGTMASGFILSNPPRFHFINSSGHRHVSKFPRFMQTCLLFQPMLSNLHLLM